MEALPEAYRAYSEWLPIRYAVDGMRSLLFYEGRPETGLAETVRFLGAYLDAVAVSRALLSRGKSPKTPESRPAE